MYAPRLQRRWCINNVEEIPGKVRKRDGVVGRISPAAGRKPNYCGGVQSRASLCVRKYAGPRWRHIRRLVFRGAHLSRWRERKVRARESPLYAHATVSPRFIRVRACKYTRASRVTWNVRTRASILSISFFFFFFSFLIEWKDSLAIVLTRVNKLWNSVKRENRRGIIEKMKLKNVYLKKLFERVWITFFTLFILSLLFFFFSIFI